MGDLDVAQFRDPNARVEEEPQHQGVLHVLGGIHCLVELAELVGGKDAAGEFLRFGGGSKVAQPPDMAADIPPVVVVSRFPPDEASNPGDDLPLS